MCECRQVETTPTYLRKFQLQIDGVYLFPFHSPEKLIHPSGLSNLEIAQSKKNHNPSLDRSLARSLAPPLTIQSWARSLRKVRRLPQGDRSVGPLTWGIRHRIGSECTSHPMPHIREGECVWLPQIQHLGEPLTVEKKPLPRSLQPWPECSPGGNNLHPSSLLVRHLS